MQQIKLFLLPPDPYNPTRSTIHDHGFYTNYEVGDAFSYSLPAKLVNCMLA
jgi:hypothetical protein